MPLYLLVALVGSFLASVILCGIALKFFPNFRSGERKEGVFRPDQSLGASASTNGKRKPPSHELPLVGSRGMVPAMLIAGGVTGWLMGFDLQQWTLMGLIGGGLVGFYLVGYIDDWKKVHSGHGMREITKFLGVAVVAIGVGIGTVTLISDNGHPYAPYSDIPGLGTILRHIPYAWPVFLILLTLVVATTSALAADFTDGLDGLAGGVTFPAALAFAVINLSENESHHYPLTVAALVLAGATLGFLPWNWPSSWNGRTSAVPRRARIIMGDSGSLALGGMTALIALADRQELSLVLVAGVFVLEGLSAVIQSRLLVKFFRRFLRVERFTVSNVWFPHTEFPLPFLATPMHHHFDLLGWDRKRLVYSAWTISAIFGILGIASSLAPFTWERYLARSFAVVIAIVLWQSGQYTRGYFVGNFSTGTRHFLGLYYGYPYRLFRQPLYAMIDQVEVDIEHLASPAERNTLWVRTNVFDARATLGYFCYRAGYIYLAREQWERIPHNNLVVRPEIHMLLTRVRERIDGMTSALETIEPGGTIETAMGAAPSPADSATPVRATTTNPSPPPYPPTVPYTPISQPTALGEALASSSPHSESSHTTAPLASTPEVSTFSDRSTPQMLPFKADVPPDIATPTVPDLQRPLEAEHPANVSYSGLKSSDNEIRFRESWPDRS